MRLLLGSAPKLMIVASSPSPYPSWAGPEGHRLSSKPDALQAVPWSVPSSRYFQTEPVATSVTGGALVPTRKSMFDALGPTETGLLKKGWAKDNAPRTGSMASRV